MGGEWGRVYSLPLLPTGSPLFEHLPARAIVLDALAPAVGNGVITLIDGDRKGVLVVSEGVVSDAVSIDDGSRSSGDIALANMRGWESSSMSAWRWTDSAMSLVEPLIRGELYYHDLRLEWTAWPKLLGDLRERGGTFVVELFTPTGRAVTVVRGGHQVATYSESHPSLGDPDLIDSLAAGGAGSIRVLVVSEAHPPRETFLGPAAAMPASPPRRDPPAHSGPAIAPPDDENGLATSPAQFGADMRALMLTPLVAFDRSRLPAATEVGILLPELKMLVQGRMRRSSGPVEDIIYAAADDHRSMDWLAERVRVMSVRGFMASTFEQLADDMLALTERA